jgi:hypothetical protein
LIDLVFLGSDGFSGVLLAWEAPYPATESGYSVNFIDRFDSLRQPDHYGDNAPEVLYLLPILPSAAGGGR